MVSPIDRLIQKESEAFVARTTRSRQARQAAAARLPLGVPATGQLFGPSSLVASRAQGAYLEDIDGHRYLDLSMGYGALLTGHAHPAIVEALQQQLAHGSLYSMPCEANTRVAELLAHRFDQPLWRFTNSGTETTQLALRLARAFTGRSRVVKMEGCYHGQHDAMLVSLKPTLADAGPAATPRPVPSSTGIPGSALDSTSVVAYNDAAAVVDVLAAGDIAAVIVEPVPTNIGILLPAEGYLQALRDACDRAGTVLVFDEIKTGITVGWRGVRGMVGVLPDLVCVSKSIAGGLPLGALGGRREIMEHIGPSGVTHVGTFSGNPLAMAAAETTLDGICTPNATDDIATRAERLATGHERIIAANSLPAHVVRLGARGCVMWSDAPVRTYRDTLATRTDLARAWWLWAVNRDVLLPPSLDSQWLVSVQHDDAHIDHALSVFAQFAGEINGKV